eukprot:gene26813-1594_t
MSFQYHSLQQNSAASFANVLERLPPPMRLEVGLYLKMQLVEKAVPRESCNRCATVDTLTS